jgi:hypothetical protein
VEILVDGERRELLRLDGRNVRHPVYSPTGHLLFETEGDLWAVGFSLRRLEVTGEGLSVAYLSLDTNRRRLCHLIGDAITLGRAARVREASGAAGEGEGG